MAIFLGIDFGTQRVGLARSYGSLAEPLTILENSDSLYQELLKVIEEEGITEIVVGLSENKMAELTKEFVAELKNYTQLPIHFTDETLSSATVHEKMYDKAKGKVKYKGHIDHLAATHFLQEYLDFHDE